MSSKESKSTCSKCNGTGWQKRDADFMCHNCNDITKICYLCQNANRTKWVDCTKCYGCGYVVKKKSRM